MGNLNSSLKQDVQDLKVQVRSLNQTRQNEQQELEKERLQLKQKKLELQKADKELEKEKVKERVADKEAANLFQIKSIFEDIKNFKEKHPEENVMNVFDNLHIQRTFATQDLDNEDYEGFYIVMTGEENLSQSLIDDTRCLEASTG